MMKQPLLSSHFLSHFDELVIEHGGDPNAMLNHCGLPVDLLSRHDTLVPTALHIKLLDYASHALKKPMFAVDMALRQSVYFLGPLTPMLCSAENVFDALNIYNKHLNLRAQGVTTTLQVKNDTAYYTVETTLDRALRSPSFQNQALTLKCNVIRWLCNGDWRPRAIFFPRPADNCEREYSKVLGAPVGFDSDNLCLSFDSKHLYQPLAIRADSAQNKLQNLMQHVEYLSTSEQARYIIQSVLASGNCDTNYVAFSLGYTRRSLQRRLKNEGTSFQGLLDSVRVEQTKSYLSNEYYRLCDISGLLGFSDPACFTRSFKRWFNTTPKQWREKHFQEKNDQGTLNKTQE